MQCTENNQINIKNSNRSKILYLDFIIILENILDYIIEKSLQWYCTKNSNLNLDYEMLNIRDENKSIVVARYWPLCFSVSLCVYTHIVRTYA